MLSYLILTSFKHISTNPNETNNNSRHFHSWRNIQCFPVIPLYEFNGVYLSGIINWLALRDYPDSSDDDDEFELNSHHWRHHWPHCSITIEKYVILSLDLSTETYTQLLLPRGFDKEPRHKPTLAVLRDNLCFCHDYEDTYLVIWQMKDFGVQESWIQLFKIDFINVLSRFYNYSVELNCLNFLPLYLSENSDTLILADKEAYRTIIYNGRGNKVKHIGVTQEMYWSEAQGYVESLVWPLSKYYYSSDEDFDTMERELGQLKWDEGITEREGGGAAMEGVEAETEAEAECTSAILILERREVHDRAAAIEDVEATLSSVVSQSVRMCYCLPNI